MAVPGQGRVPEFKIVFIGDAAVGKTSIITRFHQNRFMQDQQSTIGSAFVSKQVETKNGFVNMSFWDTAGQERYRALVTMYSRGAAVVILVFDVSLRESFEQLESWMSKITEELPTVKVVLCGNKSDLPFAVPEQEIEKWAEEHEVKLIFVSAKDGRNVSELFTLTGDLLPAAPFHLSQPAEADPAERQSGKGCC